MAEVQRMTVEEVVSYFLEGEGVDFLRESLAWVCQQLMEAEVSELVGAGRGERAPEERLTHRNGYRERDLSRRYRLVVADVRRRIAEPVLVLDVHAHPELLDVQRRRLPVDSDLSADPTSLFLGEPRTREPLPESGLIVLPPCGSAGWRRRCVRRSLDDLPSIRPGRRGGFVRGRVQGVSGG